MTKSGEQRLFQEIDPPQQLFRAILAHIEVARQRAARLRLALFGLTTLLSAFLLVPALQYAVSEFYTSGFYEYATLFISSLSGGYWKEVLYSLIDSTPSFALLLLASLISALFWSLRKVRSNARVVLTRETLPA